MRGVVRLTGLERAEAALFVRDSEQALSRKVDAVAEKYGIKKSSFAKAALYLTFIVTIITCLTCFYKADFINLTVCTVAIHVLVNAD